MNKSRASSSKWSGKRTTRHRKAPLAIPSVELLRPQEGDVVLVTLDFAALGSDPKPADVEALTETARAFFTRALPPSVRVVILDKNFAAVKVVRKEEVPS